LKVYLSQEEYWPVIEVEPADPARPVEKRSYKTNTGRRFITEREVEISDELADRVTRANSEWAAAQRLLRDLWDAAQAYEDEDPRA
jgi:hypothetical protein